MLNSTVSREAQVVTARVTAKEHFLFIPCTYGMEAPVADVTDRQDLAAVQGSTRLLRPTATIAWSTRKNTAMSIAEIERFAADLKSNEALRAEAGKTHADTSHATSVDRAVAFAASKGYAFTADKVREHARETAKAAGKELTDAELVGVAGGTDYAAVYAAAAGAVVNVDLGEVRPSPTATVLEPVRTTVFEDLWKSAAVVIPDR
jgi:hypothetical protein